MDQRIFVAQLNIEHYRRKLIGDLSEEQRRVISRLLEEEKAKLKTLRTAAFGDMLRKFMERAAENIVDALANGGWRSVTSSLSTAVSPTFALAPIAIFFVDATGETIWANSEMRRLFPNEIPSRDPQMLAQLRVLDERGDPVDFKDWLGAKAMRGTSVIPGVPATYPGDAGRAAELRVGAVPIRADEVILGALGVAYQASLLERAGVEEQLQHLLQEPSKPAFWKSR